MDQQEAHPGWYQVTTKHHLATLGVGPYSWYTSNAKGDWINSRWTCLNKEAIAALAHADRLLWSLPIIDRVVDARNSNFPSLQQQLRRLDEGHTFSKDFVFYELGNTLHLMCESGEIRTLQSVDTLLSSLLTLSQSTKISETTPPPSLQNFNTPVYETPSSSQPFPQSPPPGINLPKNHPQHVDITSKINDGTSSKIPPIHPYFQAFSPKNQSKEKEEKEEESQITQDMSSLQGTPGHQGK